MRALLVPLIASLGFASLASAGSNGGGVLLLHATSLVYTFDGGAYCGPTGAQDCDDVRTEIGPAAGTRVWTVLAVFSEVNKPALRGVEFGVAHHGIEIVDYAPCGSVEVPSSGWPADGTGTILYWDVAQTGRVVSVYWFAGYAHPSAVTPAFRVTGHPLNGGHFADDYIPPHLDEIAGYGTLGFGGAGSAVCPGPRTFVLRADGSGDRPTIQSAIDVAAPGSVLELEDGIYSGHGNRDLRLNDTPLTIRSRSGNPEACILDLGGSLAESHRGLLLLAEERNQSVIEGIQFRSGYAGMGFGFDAEGGAVKLQVDAALTLRNCIFDGSRSRLSGGAIESWGDLVLEDCVFRGNQSVQESGGGLFAGGGSLVARRCVFEGNSAADRGGAVCLTLVTAHFEECLFVGNDAPLGGAFALHSGMLRLERSTLSDNHAPQGSAVYYSDFEGSAELDRCIVAFGTGGSAVRCGLATITVSQSDLFGNSGGGWPSCAGDPAGNGNFSADPLFCDRTTGDYRLHAFSPCAAEADPARGLVGAWPVGCGVSDADSPLGPGAAAAVLSVESVTPNPSSSSSVIRCVVPARLDGLVSLRILDPMGRVVQRAELAARGEGGQEFVWDGRASDGTAVPAGAYFVEISAGSERAATRVVRLR